MSLYIVLNQAMSSGLPIFFCAHDRKEGEPGDEASFKRGYMNNTTSIITGNNFLV